MKRNIITTAIIATVAISMPLFSQRAFADSLPYEPVFESVPINESINSSAQETVKTTSTTKVTPISSNNSAVTTSVENENLQNAMLNFDSAQTEIRNQLIQYRNEYTEIDNQYKEIKAKRSEKAKQIRATEKKIKNINTLKEKTRKNMI